MTTKSWLAWQALAWVGRLMWLRLRYSFSLAAIVNQILLSSPTAAPSGSADFGARGLFFILVLVPLPRSSFHLSSDIPALVSRFSWFS